MTSILMFLFANDFGFFTMGKGVIVLYILSFAFPFVFSMIFTKIDDFISLQLMGICFFSLNYFYYCIWNPSLTRIYSTIWNSITKTNVITLS